MQENVKQIIEQAKNLKETKQRIDIIDIANSLGIDVYQTTDVHYPSLIAYDNQEQKYEIYVNANEPRTRQRFSIAHEIAHFILHKDKIKTFGAVGRQNVCSLSGKEEREADNLASELLMPTDCVNEFLKQNNIADNSKITDSFISEISKDFEVSEPVSRIKLRDMGYYVRFA